MIICSAIHVDDYQKYDHQPKNIKSGFVVCGRRHHNCFQIISMIFDDLGMFKVYKQKRCVYQGFLTDDDRFVDRKEALKIALKANQIKNIKNIRMKQLFSEDLY